MTFCFQELGLLVNNDMKNLFRDIIRLLLCIKWGTK